MVCTTSGNDKFLVPSYSWKKTTHLDQGKFNIQRKKIQNAKYKCITKNSMYPGWKLFQIILIHLVKCCLGLLIEIDESWSWITFTEDERDGENRTYRSLPKITTQTSKPLPIFPCARLYATCEIACTRSRSSVFYSRIKYSSLQGRCTIWT